MQYKRTLMSCLIVILILCTSVLGIGATEEATPFEVAVEVESSTAISTEPFVLQAGDSLTVSISINGNPTFGVIELWLKYDPEILTLVKTESGAIDYTAGDVIAADEFIVFEYGEDVIKIFNTTMDKEFEKSGTIITFNFKVKENVHASSVVELTKAAFYSAKTENGMQKIKVDSLTNANVHAHKFTAEPVVEAATCVAPSKTTYTCDTCKEEVVILGNELGAHSFGEWTTVTAPTCTEKGSDERVCTVCNTEKETKETDALGHDYSTEWTVDTEANCVAPGSKSHHCSRCDDKADVTEIAALGHDFGDWTVEKAATCTEKGSEKRTCKREGCAETETREIEALGHKPVAFEEVEATKEAVGYTGGTYCSVCNETLTERTEIPQLKDYTWIYILVAVVVVVAIGGGVCAYIFVVKKKKANG